MFSDSLTLRLALVGPPADKPCGISDYLRDLFPAMRAAADTVLLSYAEALNPEAIRGVDAMLVHYERSRVPDVGTLRALARLHPNVFVVPHEVYGEDPFAFPYSRLRAAPGLLWAKRLLYRSRHPGFFRELRLQRRGYHARGVFPLNRSARATLSLRCPSLLAAIPLAAPSGPDPMPAPAPKSRFFPGSDPAMVVGLFGFLTEANDYRSALRAVAAVPGSALLVLGGKRSDADLAPGILALAAGMGLAGRVAVTGYIAEGELNAHLAAPDLFLFPARFKSSSSSLLRLFGFGKPILAADLPLTRELAEEGAPLMAYATEAELIALVGRARDGSLRAPENRYPHSFASVARAYVDAMRRALARDQ